MKNQFIARKLLKRTSQSTTDTEPLALQTLAVQTVARNFELYPRLEGLANPIIAESIHNAIDLNSISITVLAQSIESEQFWKRACKESFAFSENNMLVQRRNADSPVTFKQKFFELYFQQLLRSKETDPAFFFAVVEVAGGFIRNLAIEEVPSQLGEDVFRALAYMPRLETLRINFLSSAKDYSFEGAFQRGLDISRARLIHDHGRFHHLRCLALENNDLEAASLKILLKTLMHARELKELRLAHNKLNEEGVRALCKFFAQHYELPLEILDLSDNDIGAEGASMLADWLSKANCSLASLGLKANFINNQGLTRILDRLLTNETSQLRTLDITANLLRDDLGELLCYFVTKNKHLSALLLDGNDIQLSQVFIQALHIALEQSSVMKNLSLRYNQIDDEVLAALRPDN